MSQRIVLTSWTKDIQKQSDATTQNLSTKVETEDTDNYQDYLNHMDINTEENQNAQGLFLSPLNADTTRSCFIST